MLYDFIFTIYNFKMCHDADSKYEKNTLLYTCFNIKIILQNALKKMAKLLSKNNMSVSVYLLFINVFTQGSAGKKGARGLTGSPGPEVRIIFFFCVHKEKKRDFLIHFRILFIYLYGFES